MRLLKRFFVPILVGAGIGANFLREVLLAYVFGASSSIDIFRVSTFIPTVFFQTMGVVLVGLYLPLYKPNTDRSYAFSDSRNVTVISLVITGIGVLTSPLVARYAAPSLAVQFDDDIFWASVWSWIGFFLVSLSFHCRIQLQSEGRSGMVASASLIFSVAFVGAMLCLLWLKKYSLSSSAILVISFCFACATLLIFYTGFSRIKDVIAISIKKKLDFNAGSLVSSKVILGAFFVQFLLVIPRLLDRSVASKMGVGGIAKLEYAYNIYTAAGMLIGTSAMIILAQRLSGVSLKRHSVRNFINLTWSTVFVALIISAFVFIFSRELVVAIYLRGFFTMGDVDDTNSYLIYLLFSFVPMVANMLLFQTLLGCRSLMLIIVPTFAKIFIKLILIYVLSEASPGLVIGVSSAACEIAFLVLGLICLKIFVSRSNALVNSQE